MAHPHIEMPGEVSAISGTPSRERPQLREVATKRPPSRPTDNSVARIVEGNMGSKAGDGS